MPDSLSCPAGSGTPALTPSATPPEPRACPWPGTAGRTGLPLSIWPGVPDPGCPARTRPPAMPRRGAPCRSSRRSPAPATWWRSPAQAARRSRRQQPAPAAASWASPIQTASRVVPAAPPARAALAITVFSGGLADGAAALETVLYPACQRVLRPGGVLAVIARPAPGQIPDLAHAVACARAAGLIYAQHIVLLHAAIDGGSSAPSPASPLPPVRATGRRLPASTPTCSS